jgi:hypothetical protein
MKERTQEVVENNQRDKFGTHRPESGPTRCCAGVEDDPQNTKMKERTQEVSEKQSERENRNPTKRAKPDHGSWVERMIGLSMR